MQKPEVVWVVRAGIRGWKDMPEQCWQRGCVAIGWERLGDLRQWPTLDALKQAYQEAYPEVPKRAVSVETWQPWSFSRDILPGHWVVTPAGHGKLAVGVVTGEYCYSEAVLGDKAPHILPVNWLSRVDRARLPAELRKRLQTRTTVFRLHNPEALIKAVVVKIGAPSLKVLRGVQSVVKRATAGVGPSSEAATVSKLVVPILEKLGWDKYKDIDYQRRAGKGVVDLALLHDGKPRVFIEAKALGVPFKADSSEVAQAIHYAADEGVEWAVLTDGLRWWVYDPFFKAPNENKRVLAVDLRGKDRKADPPEAVLLLTPQAVIEGSLRAYAERALWFQAVKAVFSSPSDGLLQAIAKEAGLAMDQGALKQVLAHVADACPRPPLELHDC